MTTFVPRAPYTKEELAQLYPQELELQLVQVVSTSNLKEKWHNPLRFLESNFTLATSSWSGIQSRPILHDSHNWPYCNSARQFSSVVMATTDWSKWDQLKYRRRLETFGLDDGPGTPPIKTSISKF
ncbi:uncharacterized protein N0V89_000910 [Didymosphaeria variabile]|uniref:Uncharacterized protein n=1 Tax=Didymosphaeria variabile TaxID=1932322 RepID=A0A9W9CFD8_9PLEO|nr:uncharacterized protein N0V89_000910 [Didymosphaeria variabile]KAJ4360348.1 hypothetical protein N0V89_000910 [Didymosphaeria variabile]